MIVTTEVVAPFQLKQEVSMKTKTSGQHGQHCAKTAASQAPPGNVAEEEVNYIFSAGVSATNTNLGGAGA